MICINGCILAQAPDLLILPTARQRNVAVVKPGEALIPKQHGRKIRLGGRVSGPLLEFPRHKIGYGRSELQRVGIL